MKINRLETHDRLLHFKKDQSLNIFQGAEDCLKINTLSLAIQEKSPYVYLYAHPRTADDGVTKRMLWQPRLSKPTPEPNSYLFRAKSKTDLIEFCWIIPPKEMWDQYKEGNVTHNPDVLWSINQYRYNILKFLMPHPDDLSEEKGKLILKGIIDEHRESLRGKQPKIIEVLNG